MFESHKLGWVKNSDEKFEFTQNLGEFERIRPIIRKFQKH